MIYLSGKKITEFSYTADSLPVCDTAVNALNKYVYAMCGATIGRAERKNSATITFSFDRDTEDDRARISFDGKILSFGGGKRGVIYATYLFLEKYVGCRFFTPDCEVLPDCDVNIEPFVYSHAPSIEFRMYLGNAADDDEFCLKRGYNGMLWNTHAFGDAEGGGYDFAGSPAHTLTGEFLLAPYVETDPEYFSLVGGKRITDRRGQVCMTNPNASAAVVREARRILDESGKSIISISQGDNGNFCECPECAEKVEKQGLVATYFGFINAVAKELKKTHPHVKVHTLAYQKTQDLPADLALEDNVLVQYCTCDFCRIHAIDDPDCEENAKAKAAFDRAAANGRSLYVWDYLNCFRHELMLIPDFHAILSDFKYFSERGVKGLFMEAEHRKKDGYAAMHELRCYLASLAAWDQEISGEEYERKTKEFICAYYGSEKVFAALELYSKACRGSHCSFDGWSFGRTIDAAVGGNVGKNVVARLIPADRHDETMRGIYELLDAAYKTVSEKEAERIDRFYACMLWYDLYHTMSDILKNGTDEEKSRAFEKNARLVDLITRHRLKLTFWGGDIDSQLAAMEKENYAAIPPDGWNYKW